MPNSFKFERLQQPPLIFAGTGGAHLLQPICDELGLTPGHIDIRRFSDGETRVKINDSVRGRVCFVIQSTSTPVNDNLIELLLILDALKRASAVEINAVIPYFGYARQDRKDEGRVPISSKLVADLIVTAGANRVITCDLHSYQIQGFFNVPMDHIFAAPIMIDYMKKHQTKDFVVVSPDVGNVKRARGYASALNVPLAIIDKRRPQPNVAEVMNIIGNIEGKDILIFDDMVDTAGTLTVAAQALKNKGAQNIYACCTHGVLSGPAFQRLCDSPIKEIFITDTIPHKKGECDKLTVISVAPLFAKVIKRIHTQESVSTLF